jgi:hypothetical protein
MRFSFRGWRPWHLLLTWSAYWVGLVLVTVSPAIAAGWRMSQQPDGRGSANVSFGNGILTATIVEAGRTSWAGSIARLNLAFLVAGPPLLLWIVWLAGWARTNNADEIARKNKKRRSELQAREPRIGITETAPSSPWKRRTREES